MRKILKILIVVNTCYAILFAYWMTVEPSTFVAVGLVGNAIAILLILNSLVKAE